MRRGRAVLAGALLAASAPAWGLWDSGAQTIRSLQALYDAGRCEAVIARLEPDGMAKLSGEDLRRGYVLLGASYEKTGRLDETLSVYQVGVRLFPKDKDLLSRLAVLMHKAGMEEQAQPLFERLVAVDPVSPYGHLGLAQIDAALGFLDRSADHYEKALEAFPQDGALWRDYSEVLYRARDWLTAELAARRALALAPADKAAALDLALILRVTGRFDEAVALLAPLVRAGRADAARAQALWLLEAGRDREAGAAVAALLRLAPSDPLGLYVRARLQLKAGRGALAAADLRQAAAQEGAPFTARVCAALAAWARGRP